MLRNQRGGSRTDTLIKLVLIFFISLLSFSVGTFVGKQFSDSQHKMASLESEYESGSARETASVPADSLEVKPEDALTEKDVQNIAEEFTNPEEGEHKAATDESSKDKKTENDHHGEERNVANAVEKEEKTTEPSASQHEQAPEATHETAHDAAKGHVAHEETPHHDAPVAKDEHHAPAKSEHNIASEKTKQHETEKSHKDLTEAAAERVAHGKSPSEMKPEPVSPLTKALPIEMASSSIGKFTVQVSSHVNEEEAKTKAEELKNKKGLSAFVVPATVKGKQWYRVSIGLFDKMLEAKSYQEKLKKDAGIPSAFVQQIVR